MGAARPNDEINPIAGSKLPPKKGKGEGGKLFFRFNSLIQ